MPRLPHTSALFSFTVGLLLQGCVDKAQEPYGRCVAAEAKGDVAAAAEACEAAVTADATSTAGKAAAQKAAELKQKLAAAKAAQDAADATAARQRFEAALRANSPPLLRLPEEWRDRLAAHFLGKQDEGACPELKNVNGADEFERREAVTKAWAVCRPLNEKAAEFVKACPVALDFSASLSNYDFKGKGFTLEGPTGFYDVHVTSNRRLYSGRDHWLLAWQGAQPALTGEKTLEAGFCKGAWLNTIGTFAQFMLYVPMDEAAAKDLRSRVGNRGGTVEAAVLLDGRLDEELIACDAKTTKAVTGKVLAWRYAQSSKERNAWIEWTAIEPWQPLPTCSEAASFFGAPKAGSTPPSAASGDGSAPKPDDSPSDAEWAGVREAIVKGSDALGCETKVVRNWFRVLCRGRNDTGGTPTNIAVTQGAGEKVYTNVANGVATLIMPYESGVHLEATFSWTDKAHKLVVHWPLGAAKPPVVGIFAGSRSPLDQPGVSVPVVQAK
jgi:hypothetical protein